MAKILLVDDSETNRDMLSRRLQRRGHVVVVAVDGRQAVDMVRAEPPDVVLMDLNLPVLDGWTATREIKALPIERGVPVIALTAHAMSGDRQRALEAGCDEYEPKPVDLTRLLSKIIALCPGEIGSLGDSEATPLRSTHPNGEQSAAQPAPAEAGDEVKGRVLIVDDTEANRDLLAMWLMRKGFAVETAADGATAIRLIGEQTFDVVLLDVMMPGVSGLDVLREVRKTLPPTELPIIMATARGASDDVVEALELGANDYVTKPLDLPAVLARLGTQVSLRRAVQQVLELERGLERRNAELQAANARMSRDLAAAAKVHAALLPSCDPGVPGYRFSWLFRPSAWLGGDIFNVFCLDQRYAGVYVLDVSGHGVAASLLSVTVSRFLSPMPDATSLLWRQRRVTKGGGGAPPAEPVSRFVLEQPPAVAHRLSQRFPFDDSIGQFFTMVYGILDAQAHQFVYTSAGHPNMLLVPREGAARTCAAEGFPIGVGDTEYDSHAIDLAPGDRLYLYSDGLTEAINADGDWLGVHRLLEMVDAERRAPLDDGLSRVIAQLDGWTGSRDHADDQTILAIERLPD